MAKLLEKIGIPFGFGLWDMSNGDKYTIDDDNNVNLTPELAESDKKTDAAYQERYKKASKGNGGKDKEKFKVEKSQLSNSQEETRVEIQERETAGERDER